MIDAETALLVAVRDRLRTELTLDAGECDVELDDEVPAIAGDRYVAVVPGGMVPGPRHNTSGGVWDMRLACRVTVFHRMRDVPRDRRRSVFLQRVSGINAELSGIISQVDFSYALLNAATVLLEGQADGGKFFEPLKFAMTDERPVPVFRDAFDAAGNTVTGADPVVAIKRGVRFAGARFLKTR